MALALVSERKMSFDAESDFLILNEFSHSWHSTGLCLFLIGFVKIDPSSAPNQLKLIY